MFKMVMGALFVAMAIGGIFLLGRYGTLQPCGMLEAEIEMRTKNADLTALAELPDYAMNKGDGPWCSKRLVQMWFD